MKLSKLTMDGFKSFGNRTEINFDDGITVVVGPNGCGKSNVVDAMKWVLGERSTKALRSEEMLDVIFNGASSAKPSGYAEVSLAFDNSGASAKLPLDYEEVTVSRRLHRSGESEYFINNQTCRLKDIRELFMGTGVGMESYSIIEQGKVDFILRSNPVERRELLDEAAGISKYKAKKHETELKLQKVEQDLIRLQDILREVRREIRSIKIQAGKAEKYKSTLEELKEKKTQLALQTYYQYQQKHNGLLQRASKLKAVQAGIEKRLEEIEEVIISIDKQIILLDNDINTHQESLISLSGKVSEVRLGVESAQSRSRELGDEKETTRKNIEACVQKTIDLRGRLCDMIQSHETAQREIDALNNELGERNEIYREITGELKACNEDLESSRNEIFQTTQKKTTYQNELAAVQNELKNLSAKREKFSSKRKDFEGEAAQTKEKIGSLGSICSELKQANNDLKQTVSEREITYKALEDDLARINEEYNKLKDESNRMASRKDVLNDLEKHYEGCSNSVRLILEGKLTVPVGILGLVADIVVIKPQFVNAAEGALKGLADALLVNSQVDGIELIHFVQDAQKGRITSISMDKLKTFSLRAPISNQGISGILGYADEIIDDIKLPNIPADIKSALGRLLLGNYLLVDNMETAHQVLKEHLYDGRILTVNGEVITSDGVITGGSMEAGLGLISRKTELRSVDEILFAVASRLNNLEQVQSAKLSEIENAKFTAQALRNMVYDQAVKITDIEKEIAESNRRSSIISKEIEITDLEASEVEQQINLLSERAVSTNQVIKEFEANLEVAQSRIESLNGNVKELSEKKHQIDAAITNLKVRQATAVSKKEHLIQQEIQADNDISQLEITLEISNKTLKEMEVRISDLLLKIESDNLALQELVGEQQEIQNNLASLRENTKKLKDGFSLQKEEEEKVNSELQSAQEEMNKINIAEREYFLKIENICDKHQEETGVNLRESSASYQPPPESDSNATVDWQKINESIDELKKRLGDMADVNLSAIDQLKTLEERNTFLSVQEQDLIKSKESLQEFIRKTNRECRERFESTFATVAENFNQLFRKLFGGGKAELILERYDNNEESAGNAEDSANQIQAGTDSQAQNGEATIDPTQIVQPDRRKDILDSGIEIIAKPPGKEPTCIKLLSGGEKTLTALALIMAIFKLQPSPFCVLDEADSTLDENNVDRFCGLIKDFASETQFIVITHNKKTMLVGDILYGLTMPTPGISRKMSVKMDEAEKLLDENKPDVSTVQATGVTAN